MIFNFIFSSSCIWSHNMSHMSWIRTWIILSNYARLLGKRVTKIWWPNWTSSIEISDNINSPLGLVRVSRASLIILFIFNIMAKLDEFHWHLDRLSITNKYTNIRIMNGPIKKRSDSGTHKYSIGFGTGKSRNFNYIIYFHYYYDF